MYNDKTRDLLGYKRYNIGYPESLDNKVADERYNLDQDCHERRCHIMKSPASACCTRSSWRSGSGVF